MQMKVLLSHSQKLSLVPVLNQINQVYTLISHLSDIQTPSNLAMKQCKIKFPTVVCQVLTINRLQRCMLLNSTQKVRLQSTVTINQHILSLHNICSVCDKVSCNQFHGVTFLEACSFFYLVKKFSIFYDGMFIILSGARWIKFRQHSPTMFCFKVCFNICLWPSLTHSLLLSDFLTKILEASLTSQWNTHLILHELMTFGLLNSTNCKVPHYALLFSMSSLPLC